MWYKAGTVALISGNKAVLGTGTDFISNVKSGYVFYGPDNVAYEVESISGSGELKLALPYSGPTAAGQQYGIWQTQGIIAELSRQAATILEKYQAIDSNVSITAANAADSSANKKASDISAANAATYEAGSLANKNATAVFAAGADAAKAAAQDARDVAVVSKNAAGVSETNSSRSEFNALGYKRDAEAASAASNQFATSANASRNAAQVSEVASASSANAASGKAADAANSASMASTKASLSDSRASDATAEAKAAAISASAASDSENQAAISAGNAAISESHSASSAATATGAASALTAALATFRKVFLGSFPADPAVDGNGEPLTEGAEYFNTVSDKLRTYVKGAWQDYDATAQAATNNANLSALDAASSASVALNKATAAAASAVAAKNSESAAAESRTAAAASQEVAGSKATEANSSAADAQSSKNAAAAFAADATGSKVDAAKSAASAQAALETVLGKQVNSDWNATGGKEQILNKPALAQVATSGSYADLKDKPEEFVRKVGDTILGPLTVAASVPSAVYDTHGLEVREAGLVTTTSGNDIAYAPKITFHWGGYSASQLRLTYNNTLEFVNGDGTTYGVFKAGSINATGEMSVGGKGVWHAGNFNPTSKQDALGFNPVQQGGGTAQLNNKVMIGWTGVGLKAQVDSADLGDIVFGDRPIRLNWNGLAGQPAWLFGGNSADAVNVYDPANFSVYNAKISGTANKALAVDNGADLMKFNWRDPGGQTSWIWGSDGPTSARLMTTAQLRVGYAAGAGVSDRASVSDIVSSKDTRDSNFAPQDRNGGVYFDMKLNSVDGLNDGGTYHAAMTFRPWGSGSDFSGGKAHQLGFTDNGNIKYRNGSGASWANWVYLLHSGNFDPASKQNALGFTPVQQSGGIGQTTNKVYMGWSASSGLKVTVDATDQGSVVFGDRAIRLNWNGLGGQPPWLFGGSAPGDVNVYNPANFSVNYAASAGTSTNAENISNGNSYMRMNWSDPGGQTLYVWGSDGPTSARLSVVGNLSVGNARTWSGFPLRFAENPGVQPYYVLGIEAGRSDFSIYNRTSLTVGTAVNAGTALYAAQLIGPGLQNGSVGSHALSKSKSSSGLPGTWEIRGQPVYDFGSGAAEADNSSVVLWQRVA